jgi:plasmid stabilization system protein ParE
LADYILSKSADEDLKCIFEYTLETRGADQLAIYALQVGAALRQIAGDPTLPRSKTRKDLAAECRTFPASHHFIVSRVNRGQVEVARILHEPMDFENETVETDFPNGP